MRRGATCKGLYRAGSVAEGKVEEVVNQLVAIVRA
jgi:hypothetical protein